MFLQPNLCMNAAVLDSACSSTVAGENWINCYLDTLTDDEQRLVKKRPSSTVFRFGGGERLQSNGRVTFPCHLAGKSCEITTDVVQSDIPLLLSKDAMKKAEMKLDLVHDQAEIFGKDVELQSTSSGHYCVPLKEVWLSVNDGVFTNISFLEKQQKIKKIHKQFGHPTSDRLKRLLIDANVYDTDCQKVLDDISESCDTVHAKSLKGRLLDLLYLFL